jgi:hypothetical protein
MQNDKSMWANSSFETETHEHTFSTITKGDDPMRSMKQSHLAKPMGLCCRVHD